MKVMLKRTTAFMVGLVLTYQAYAQTEATGYFMNGIPQVTIHNPAFVPNYKFSIGLPFSSVMMGYSNNGFSYNDLITRQDGKVNADLNKLVKSLADKNYITAVGQMDLLRVGFTINPKLYMQVNATGKMYSRFQLPKEVASLFVDGTAPLVGTSSNFSPEAEGLSYLETAVSASYQLNEKLTIGARVKYLKGIANATTDRSAMSIAVSDSYEITASGDMSFRTSGINNLDQSDYNFGEEWKNYSKNNGYGIDLGASYQLMDKLTVAASIIDLGRISWKNDLYSYSLDKATANYTFSGVDIEKIVNGDSKYFDAELDSIENKFELKEGTISSYSTWLPGKMFVSGNYELMKNLNVGAVLFTEKFQGRFSPGGSASLIKNFGKWVSTSVSYTISNRSFNNLGAGVSFNLAPVQFYIVGDNLLRMPLSLIAKQNINGYVNSTQVFNVRFGMNIVWGRIKGKESTSVTGETKAPEKSKSGSKSSSVTGGKKAPEKAKPSYIRARKKSR
jgi:hypothetical protein